MEPSLFAPELIALLGGLLLFGAPLLGAGSTTNWRLAIVIGLATVAGAIWTLPMSGDAFAPGIYHIDAFSQSVKVVL
ncbi:MAG: hypothetical protein HOC05_01270, partial [Gemmatimonadetes bacterium]|nr:hypothetical protein [Gemmatimonadota bacterium]